jgi:hypothetical protein
MSTQTSTIRGAVPVVADNYIRAESDFTLASIVKQGGFGRFLHFRELIPLDRQVVPRSNRDTLYSAGVFDLDAGPVTLSLPDPGRRFLSLMVVDEDHYVYQVVYGGGTHTFTRSRVGTRYALAAMRILVDPASPKDIQQVNALQDAVRISQPSAGRFEPPNWDPAACKRIHDALLVLNETLPDLRHAFGGRGEVDPIRHLIATASAWGGNPDHDAIYLNVTPALNDGRTVYRLTVRDVPVDGFWSITVYNADGYLEPNPLNAYSLNSITATSAPDGAVTVQFGGCDGGAANCLPIMPGWNYMVRLYRPHDEILDGRWTFPEAQAVQ